MASNRSKQQMKSQIASENRQAHIVFGVVVLFFIGCIPRIVLNVEEIHQELTKDENCDYVVRDWIHVRLTFDDNCLKYMTYILLENY